MLKPVRPDGGLNIIPVFFNEHVVAFCVSGFLVPRLCGSLGKQVYSSHTGEAYSQLVLVRVWFGLHFIMKCLTNSLGAGQSGGHA